MAALSPMRALIAAVAALLVAPTATAAAPGFVRSAKLTPVASFVAKKPVTVWCATSDAAWVAALEDAGLPAASHGTADIERGVLWVEKVICNNLAISLRYGAATNEYAAFVPSLLIFVHESIHLRGVKSEAKTDCAAAREVTGVALRFFDRQPIDVAMLKKRVARFRASSDAIYRSVC